MLNIRQIREFSPEDVPSVTFEGKVGYVGTAKRKTSPPGAEREYDFWSQFITVEDDTDKVGVSLAIKTDEKSLNETDKGRQVKITNGKLRDYQDKNGKTQREIRSGKIEFLDAPKGAAKGSEKLPEKVANDKERWLEKDRQIAAQAVAKSLIEAGLAEPTQQNLDWATAWCVWIDLMRQGRYNGQTMEELQQDKELVNDGRMPEDNPEIPENEQTETGKRTGELATIHILKKKLKDAGYWAEDGYKLWLRDEFDKDSSKDLTPEERTKAIRILAGWMNERLEKNNG